jgi:O-glycosyl hydrolase
MKNKFLLGILSLVTVFGLLFAGCFSDVEEKKDKFDAQPPTITEEPQISTQYKLNETILPLTVTATVSDGGKLEYQWYSKANASGGAADGTGATGTGATTASFTPGLTAEGTTYYYVDVTNYNSKATGQKRATRTSRLVSVTVYDPENAQPPNITVQPRGGTYMANQEVTLSVTATVISGTLSYQWYRNSTESNSGGREIPDETDAEYIFTPTIAETAYYYVIVTNTDDNVTGNKTTDTVSNPVTVKVEANPFDDLLGRVNVTLDIDNGTRYQYVRGYGGMSNVEFRAGNGSPSPDVTVADAHALYNRDPIVVDSNGLRVSGGLGLNFMRICLYDDLDGIIGNTVKGPGPQGSQAAGPDRDNSDYFELVKVVNQYKGYVLASPWTFPVEYKSPQGSTLIGSSGEINTTRFDDLAQYFKTYLERMTAQGAPVFAVIIQNEPNVSVGYEGCRWLGTSERDFIRILGPVLADYPGYGGGKTWDKVWIGTGEESGAPGTSQNNIINDSGPTGAEQWVEFVPRHYYGSAQFRYTLGLNAGKEVWQTEHTDTTNAGRDSSYPVMATWNWVWHLANELYCSTGLNDESVYIWWYMKRFYGFLGDTGNNSGTTWSAVLPRGYVMSHFSKYAADTTRIGVTAGGSFVSNAGINASTGDSSLGDTSLPVSSSNLNPASFASGNTDTGGQNQPTTKVLAFESSDGDSIIVIAFTPTRNSGAGGQNAGNVLINLPAGFSASKAELMRTNADVRHQMEVVPMSSDGKQAIITLPRSNIVSVKFTR